MFQVTSLSCIFIHSNKVYKIHNFLYHLRSSQYVNKFIKSPRFFSLFYGCIVTGQINVPYQETTNIPIFSDTFPNHTHQKRKINDKSLGISFVQNKNEIRSTNLCLPFVEIAETYYCSHSQLEQIFQLKQ